MSACSTGLELGEVEQEAGCPPWECLNSPEVMHYRMHEANLFGLPDAQGISLRTEGGRALLYSGEDRYELHVIDNRFVGIDGSSIIEGTDLVGAEIEVLLNEQPLYNITIRNVREIPMPLGDNDMIEVYRLTRREPEVVLSDSLPACNSPSHPLLKGNPELLGMDPDETLIFAGDRIDPSLMATSEHPDFDWFNFGCAGHTLAKLHLTRNTITTEAEPSWDGRQAHLKMLVADYCGVGKPITVSGTPLRWRSNDYEYAPTPDRLEARWGPHGAECVDVMRLEIFPSLLFADPRSEMEQHCQPPPCENTDLEDVAGALRVSAIPQ